MHCRTNIWVALVAVVIAAILDAPLAVADGPKEDRRGALFVMTNSAASDRGNEVVMYERDRDGNLTLIGFFPTGRLENGQPQRGAGPSPTSTVFGAPIPATADALGSSNSLILGRGNHCLFAVNAGSNTVSSFQVHPHGLELVSIFSSQGDLDARFPVSLTESRNILYVLNAGDKGSLTGFRVRGNCSLVSLEQSSRDLSDVTNSFATPAPGEVLTTPAQASFTPDGQRLVLSVKGGPDGGPFPSGRMAVFPVDDDGLLGMPVVTQFSVAEERGGPFSFTFVDAETIIVVHANSQTVASYTIGADNTITLLSGPFNTGGFAPCWLDGTNRFVYTASFGGIPALGTSPDGDGVLNGFRVRQNGTLVSLGIGVSYPAPGPGRSGNHAIDVRVVGRFLYFLQPRLGMVGRLTIEQNGDLVGLTNFGGLSPGVEPFAVLNPGINDFLERCFLQDPTDLSPECLRGSIQGIAGF